MRQHRPAIFILACSGSVSGSLSVSLSKKTGEIDIDTDSDPEHEMTVKITIAKGSDHNPREPRSTRHTSNARQGRPDGNVLRGEQRAAACSPRRLVRWVRTIPGEPQ